jgi:phenylacetate-CoA ligase
MASRIVPLLSALAQQRQLRAHERLSRDELLARQAAALARLASYVSRHSPFYRAHWGGELDERVTLEQLAPVKRSALMTSFDAAVTDPALTRAAVEAHLAASGDHSLLAGRFHVMASSGSTGEPARFVYDAAGYATFLAGCLRWTRSMGVRPSLPRTRIAGIGAPTGRHMTCRAARSLDVGLFDSLRLPASAPLEVLVAALNRHQPHAINAYPSVAALLAEEQLAGRLRVAPRVFCTSSEQRTPDVTARLTRAFNVAPYDCYATTETGITAVDCAEHAGLHVYEDLCIVEVVDEAGRAVPPGTLGAKVLVTNLYNRALPMIRVELSDLLVEEPGACPCGLPFKRLRAVEGRADDMLLVRRADGSDASVHAIRLRTALGAIAGLVQYRVDVYADGLAVEVVMGEGASASRLQQEISEAVAAVWSGERAAPPPLRVRTVSALARDPSAKLKVVRRHAGSWAEAAVKERDALASLVREPVAGAVRDERT